LIYKRRLTPSEAKRHFVYIAKDHRNMFPPPGKEFKVDVDNQKIDVKIDSKWRIWAALFWEKLPSFQRGDVVVFSKLASDTFKVEVEKQSG